MSAYKADDIKPLKINKKNPEYKTDKKQVFIIGSKGIPAAYGGFETFCDSLVHYQKSDKIRYHISVLSDKTARYEYKGAKCFEIKVPQIGAAKAIYYDLLALKRCIKYCKVRPSIKEPVFYVLACRIGPFTGYYKKQIKKLGGKLFVNPDGHEFLRKKWSSIIRAYWKFSERLMVKYANLLICDNRNIETYIKEEYKKYNPTTTFIAYGANTGKSILADDDNSLLNWYLEKNLTVKNYYLIVGRFVPENNFELMISEFIKSKTDKDLAIITTVNDKFLKKLEKKLNFKKDKRIKFVGTVYDKELLKKIRENAYGYLHGHEVGGTNPSLLEAMSSTDLNLLLDVGFNREVGENTVLYWTKENGDMTGLIKKADTMNSKEISDLGLKAKKRIVDEYNWKYIVDLYEKMFLENVFDKNI